MDIKKQEYKAHVLAIPAQWSGHINPLLQLCKSLVRRGLKTTLTISKFISKTMDIKSEEVQIDLITDGYDDGGFFTKDIVPNCMARFEDVGSKSILELIQKYEALGEPIDYIIYDTLLPFVLELSKELKIPAAAFLTQHCGINFIMHQYHHRKIPYPTTEFPVLVPSLPPLEREDLPSFVNFPYHFKLVADQFSNINQADCVLVNTYYELEPEVVDELSKHCPVLTIGPTIPSFYLGSGIVSDKEYGLSSSRLDPSACLSWLHSKPERSVVYASLSSVGLASFGQKQIVELALALKNSNYYFLWSVKEFEVEKLPKNYKEEISEKGYLVEWSPQLEVLSSKAVGCIVSHCGWNSTIESLSLGVPIVAMPQFVDQQTNAKFVQDVWKVGLRPKLDENGIGTKEEIGRCIKEVMEGEYGKEMKENAMKWSKLAKLAVSEGGSSDRNINSFVTKVTRSS